MITTRDCCSLLKPLLTVSILGFYLSQAAYGRNADADASNTNANDTSTPLAISSTDDDPNAQELTAPELGGLPVNEALYTLEQLRTLVGPYALYPDDLLAIILPAATYPLEIVLAARFLERLQEDDTLEPEESWDDSIVALLNYPEVIDIMNESIDESWQLGEAVISQQSDVLQAIEDFRQLAYDAGNLETDAQQVVEVVQKEDQESIVITQVEEEVIYVPKYVVEEVIVKQHVPVYDYHPVPRPVYYYPYPVGHRFHSGFFWGVTTAFSIGWSDYFLHVYHPSYRYHPYYGHRYYYNDYHYRRPSINIFNNYYVDNSFSRIRDRHRYGSYWRPQRHFGSRPFDNRYNNYYLGGRSSGDGRRRDVTDFATDRRRSQLGGQAALSTPNSPSDFAAESRRGPGDRRGGGRIGQPLTNGTTTVTSNPLTRSADTRTPRAGNGSNAERFNALRGNRAETLRGPDSTSSTASRSSLQQRSTQSNSQTTRRAQQNSGATFDAFRNRSRGRTFTNNRSLRTAPREDSSSLVTPSNQSATTARTQRPNRNTSTPRISSDRDRRRVTADTPQQQPQVQRRWESGVNRSSSSVIHANQGGQRSVSERSINRSAAQSQPSARPRAQISAPRRQAPSIRSNSSQRSSAFNSNRRGSSSMQRAQQSRPQISQPQTRSAPSVRPNRSAPSFSSNRLQSIGGGVTRAGSSVGIGGRSPGAGRANRRNR